MKIYTKTGDRGTTSLKGGTRLRKSHQRIEAYGTVDELIAYIGLIKDLLSDSYHSELTAIQDRLMTVASNLAAEPDMNFDKELPELTDRDSAELETLIDGMEKNLEPLTAFILPGGHQFISHCHIARNVCRRAERAVLRVEGNIRNFDPMMVYLNRLSDYLFVLARTLTKDLNIDEEIWNPRF